MYDVDDGDDRPIRGSRVFVALYALGWAATMWIAGHPYVALFAVGLVVGLGWGSVRKAALGVAAMMVAGCGGASESPSSAEAQANTACIDRGDADIPTATVQASDAESACLAAQCIPNVQCGDPGKTTCVFVHGVHGQEGIWDCPLGCCY